MVRAMKDSGIEWIGEIPDDWCVSRHKYVMHKEKIIGSSGIPVGKIRGRNTR